MGGSAQDVFVLTANLAHSSEGLLPSVSFKFRF